MSALAIAWVDSIQVGNSTAKALLRFLASHNFHKPGFYFKNSTYMAALEISEATLKRAFAFLKKGNWITYTSQFDESGRQKTNYIDINIPDWFIEQYEQKIEKGEGLKMNPLGGSKCAPPPVKMSPSPPKKTRNSRVKSIDCKTEADPNININIKSNVKLLPKTQKMLCPLDFKPNSHHYELAKKYGIDADEESKALIDWSHSTMRKKFDWDRTFNNWLRSEHKFNKKGNYHAKESGAEIMHRVVAPTLQKIKTSFEEFTTGFDQPLISQT